MHIQIECFIKDKPSKLLTRLGKNRSTQQCQINILEKLKNTFSKSGFIHAMFMNTSKTFDTVD